MNKIFYIVILFFLSGNQAIFSQEIGEAIKGTDTIKLQEIDPLRPTKAAFYSAIVPGLGQA